MLISYIRNRSTLLTICNRYAAEIDPTIRLLIQDNQLKKSVRDLLAVLGPIASAMNQMKANSLKIADGVMIWRKLSADINEAIQMFPSEAQRYIEGALNVRYANAITDAHLAAYELSAKYLMRREYELNSDERIRASAFICHRFPVGFMSKFLKFKEQVYPFSMGCFSPMAKSKVSDADWWMSLNKMHDQALCRREYEAIMQLATATLCTVRYEYDPKSCLNAHESQRPIGYHL